MPERSLPPMASVEALLADVGDHLAWPSLPDSVAAARNRIAAGERPAHPAGRWRRFALGAALAAVIALAVAVTLPGSRSALADLFGLGGVTVRQVSTTVPVSSAPPATRPALDLGEVTTLDEAASAVTFTVFTPSAAGAPAGVYLDEISGRPVVTLTYEPTAALPQAPQTDLGLLVTQFAGTIEPFIEKLVRGPGAERLTVAGAPAIWVEGPHEILFEDGRGVASSRNRLAASTLVVSRDGTTIRLEGAFDQATAVAVAESLVPVPPR